MLHDDQDQIRVVPHRPDLADLLELALAQPRRYDAQDPAVLSRLTSLPCELAWHASQDQHQAIVDQLSRLHTTTMAQDFDAAEHARLTQLIEQVEQALAGRWMPGKRTS